MLLKICPWSLTVPHHFCALQADQHCPHLQLCRRVAFRLLESTLLVWNILNRTGAWTHDHWPLTWTKLHISFYHLPNLNQPIKEKKKNSYTRKNIISCSYSLSFCFLLWKLLFSICSPLPYSPLREHTSITPQICFFPGP